MSRSKRDTDQGATPDHVRPRKPSLADLDDLDARPFARKRLLDAARDHGEWSGTGDSDTMAETGVDAGQPTEVTTDVATELHVPLHDPDHESDFTDEDTFTDRDTEADVTVQTSALPGGLAGMAGMAGGPTGRDTMLELTPRDTLLDLTAAARAASSADSSPGAVVGDRTLDDDEFPDEDTEPGK